MATTKITVRIEPETPPRVAWAALQADLTAGAIDNVDAVMTAAWPAIEAMHRHQLAEREAAARAAGNRVRRSSQRSRELAGPGYRIRITTEPETRWERWRAELGRRLQEFRDDRRRRAVQRRSETANALAPGSPSNRDQAPPARDSDRVDQ